MNKYHNVKFLSDLGATLYLQDDNTFSTFKEYGVYAGEAYYIHPDCHEILKPQIGDIIQWTIYKNTGRIAEQTFTREATKDIIKSIWHKENESMVSDKQIIQRNGKAFFMPEVENEIS